MPLAVAKPGSVTGYGNGDDAATDCQHAWGTREGATEGALKLQKAGLIDYTRGRIQVLDRAALEKRTCECYAVVKKEYDRLLPDKLAA